MIQNRQRKANAIVLCLLILFSIATALGSFNPFGFTDNGDIENAASPITLTIQGFFIVSLLPLQITQNSLNKCVLILAIFVIVWIISSLLYASISVNQSFYISTFKLILCIILFFKLPELIHRNPKYLVYSIMAFAITCAVISTLFSLGLLNQYTSWHSGRLVLFNENPNSTSTRMLFSILFLMYFVYRNPFKMGTWRTVLLIFIIPLLFTIMASGSRGSFIVLIICLTLYLFLMPTKKIFNKYILIAITAGFTVFMIIKFAQSEEFSIMERLASYTNANEDGGRTNLSNAALSIFMDYPILGVGGIEFPVLMKELYGYSLTVHNLYWYIAATTGIVGLSLFGPVLYHIFMKTWRLRKKSQIGFVLLFGMLLITSKTGGALTYMLMWYIFAVSYSFSSEYKSL